MRSQKKAAVRIPKNLQGPKLVVHTVDANAPVASLAQLTKPVIRSVIVPKLVDGQDLKIFYRSLRARTAAELPMTRDTLKSDQRIGITKVVEELARDLCTEDGSDLLTQDQLLDLPMDRLFAIYQAILNDINKRARSTGEV